MKRSAYFLSSVMLFLGAMALLPSVSHGSSLKASAQTEVRYLWANVGAGFGSVRGGLGEDSGGISGGISLSYCAGSSLFSIRGVEIAEFKLDLWGYSGPPERVWDIGVLYGRVAKGVHGIASISAGIGIAGASKYDRAISPRFGIPIEGQLFWTPNYALGFGIYGFANVNSYKSFLGLLVCFQLGRQI
jgi:hypothetical protein